MDRSMEREHWFVPQLRQGFIRHTKFHSNKSGLTKLTLVLFSLLVLLSCCPQSSMCKGGVGGVTSDEKEDSSSAGVGDSVEEDAETEMSEYLDDEVRFVTEDEFLYEEERSHYRDYHQYERCPPLPDASVVAVSGICDAKRCQRDDECSRDGSVICCYNGCIYACLPRNIMNPPVAFDWVEETDFKFVSKDHSPPQTDAMNIGISPKSLVDAEVSPETVSLPGGCFINSKQFDDLLMFRKFDHVRACSCNKGEVFCEINHKSINLG